MIKSYLLGVFIILFGVFVTAMFFVTLVRFFGFDNAFTTMLTLIGIALLSPVFYFLGEQASEYLSRKY